MEKKVGNSNLCYLANSKESGDSDNDEARTKQKTDTNSMAASRSNSRRNSANFLNFPQFQLDLKLAVQKAK